MSFSSLFRIIDHRQRCMVAERKKNGPRTGHFPLLPSGLGRRRRPLQAGIGAKRRLGILSAAGPAGLNLPMKLAG